MDRIKAMIVDDMPLAIASLEADIRDKLSDKIDIVAKAQGVIEAAKYFRQYEPELIFLDIQMDDGDGFDLLDIIGKEKVKVIFTTASKAHALKAFRYAAVDYLLKPVDIRELSDAVERIAGAQDKHNNTSDTIAIRSLEAVELFEFRHIVRLEADSNYTRLFLDDGGKRVISKTLKSFEGQLDKRFVRTHQSHIVNKDFIKSFVRTEGGYLILKDGEEIPVSVRRRSYVNEMLSK